jgi:MFS family permease
MLTITLIWSRVVIVHVLLTDVHIDSIWFVYFINAFILTIQNSLNPYVTSSFQAHSLSAVPTAIGDVMAAATYLPMAKMMDVWGRAEGVLVMELCLVIGLVLMASCNTFEAYCAANVSLKLLPPALYVLILTPKLLGLLLHRTLWSRIRNRCCDG